MYMGAGTMNEGLPHLRTGPSLQLQK
jgi:hypothetical protein